MLGTHKRQLNFPIIVYKSEVSFIKEEKKKSSLYILDWDSYDEHLGAFLMGAQLPPKYDSIVKNLIYAIPPHYKREINRLCNLAVYENSIERQFDTNIREMLLDVRDQAIKCAFKLLSDCVYDEDTNFFYHKPDKFLLWRMLVYRFWVHQTGRGLPWYMAELDKLEMEVNLRNMAEGDRLISIDFIQAIKQLEKDIRALKGKDE